MNLSSTHVIHGFKTALAAVLAYAVTTLFNLEFGFWAVLSTVIVMQVYVADSIELCLSRFTGTLIGALLGVLVILVVPKTDFFIGCALFVTIGICGFLTHYRTRYRMAAITVVIVVMTGAQAQDIMRFGTYRVLEICVGILCAFFVSVLVLPRRKVDVLKEKLEAQARECGEKCTVLVEAFISKQQNVKEDLVDDLVKDVWANHALLQKVSQHEALLYHRKFNENFPAKVAVLSRSAEHLRNLVRTLNSLDGDGYDIVMSRELKNLAAESGKALVSLVKSESSPATNDLKQLISDLDIKLVNIRKEGLIRRFDSKRLIQVFSFYSSLYYFSEDILAGIENL